MRALRERGVLARDGGFTLIELIVAMGVMGIVMTALTVLFANSITATGRESGRQVGMQLADDAIEQAHSLDVDSLLKGRTKTDSDQEWALGVADSRVKPYLTDMAEAYDATAATGAKGLLPAAGTPVVVNSITFTKRWYIGTCWQKLSPASSSDAACGVTKPSSYVQMYRVVAAVTWPEQHCTGGTCAYVTSTLVSCGAPPLGTAGSNAGDCVSPAGEPVFGTNQTQAAPTVNNPGNQGGDVGVPVSMQVTASGGAAPITWSAVGLPAGLSISSGGMITGTPTVAGSSTVTITATDAFPQTGTAAFTWVVNPPPALANPGTQTTTVGATVGLTLTCTGGTAPLTWSQTGLPAGLTLDSTGKISGSPTTAGTSTVVVTVTDAVNQTSSATFTYTVNPAPTVTTPSAQGTTVNRPFSLQIAASGGTTPYKWSVTGLPSTLTINSASGLISGTPTVTGTYGSVVVKITDAAGVTAQTSAFTVTVNAAPTITTPAAQTTTLNRAASLQITASGGTKPYTWSVTGLPSTLTINSSGLISGTPTATGTYSVVVKITDAAGATAQTSTFTWKVQ